jgi:hypothetical protein
MELNRAPRDADTLQEALSANFATLAASSIPTSVMRHGASASTPHHVEIRVSALQPASG